MILDYHHRPAKAHVPQGRRQELDSVVESTRLHARSTPEVMDPAPSFPKLAW